MRGFILAAGFGTRLMPLTAGIPKALIPVCGIPLLERSLRFLSRQGIKLIGVNAHYHAEQLRAFQKRTGHPFALFHEKKTIRGTGGGLYAARRFLAGDEAFFVCNADILLDFDLRAVADRFLQSGWDAALLVDPREGSAVYYDPDSHAYCGVPADTGRKATMASGAFIGAALYRPSFLDLLDSRDISVVPVWKRGIDRGLQIGILEVADCFWRDIGTPAALARIHFDCIDGATPVDVPDRLSIDREGGRCFLRSMPEHVFRALGRHAWVETDQVGENVRISQSVVFPGVNLTAGRTFENMIVMPDCEVPIGL